MACGRRYSNATGLLGETIGCEYLLSNESGDSRLVRSRAITNWRRTMYSKSLICVVIFVLGRAAFALTNTEFTSFGSGWTTYTGGSGAVTFDGNVAEITAFVFATAGLEQTETAFTTTGQEYRLEIQVNNNGNVLAGW